MADNNSTTQKMFSWVKFYEELAGSLLKYKDKRGLLLEKLDNLDNKWVPYLRDKETEKWKFHDIDPFSVFAIFNRGIKNETRFIIAQRFKDLFQLKSEVPSDLWGIPVAFNTNSIFFAKENVNTDINPLWKLFESAINYPNDDSFIESFNKVLSQKQIGMTMITMALYWIRPNTFITLDSNTQDYLKSNGIQIMKRRDFSGQSYLELIEKIHNSKFANMKFPQISRDAWLIKHPQNEDRGIEENLESDPFTKKVCDILRMKKNVVLQGAPGTGKTYSTAAIALGILGIEGVNFKDHNDIMEKYNDALISKRIFFTTFHQSMDYEDFVEGLKPKITKDKDNKPIGITYKISKGIFRKVCKTANKVANRFIASIENSDTTNLLYGLKSNPMVWKISLDGLCGESIHADCLKNNYICLPNEGISKDISKARSYLNYLQNKMKVGDIVLSSISLHEIDAIGIVTGEYENLDSNKDFPYHRKVRWIVKDIHENIVNINQGKNIATFWFHKFPNISIKGILDLINKHTQRKTLVIDNDTIDNKAAVVLIIDEINRGNVSKIFGELVTLLEKDKRDNGDHPITVTLPYSKEEFSVPSNVYIIGTMNTTDRSTGTIDYAVRRRFAFVTTPTKKDAEQIEILIKLETAKNLYKDIKDFIDKKHSQDMDIEDLMVGHSYFMAKDENELKLKIEYEVAPLLKEYCNDGLLTCSMEELNDHIKAWIKLETYKQDLNTTTNTANTESETSQSNE